MSDKKVQRSNMVQTDSKGNITRSARDNSDETEMNFRWWTLDEKEMAGAITATVRFIQTHNPDRISALIGYTNLYGNSSTYNFYGSSYNRSAQGKSQPVSERISYNVCQSVVDTLTAKMAKNKVIPTYITNGGVWSVQKKAKQLTKFTQGLFYGEDVHTKSIDAFNDAGVWGDGFVHVFRKNDKVAIERTLPHELWVDEVEGLHGDPRQLHRTKIVDRLVALSVFPDLEEEIMDESNASYQDIGGQFTAGDLIVVTESWHLPSSKDATDGIRAVTIGMKTKAESYTKDYFPFPHFRYAKEKLGWYATGACKRLSNLQAEINRGMILKQRSLWMQGSFKVLLENGSKVVSQHLNNDVGAIIHYTGTPPQYVTPPATNPELQQWIDSLIDKAYRQEGVSQLSAAAEKPMGVDSGKAMRTLTNIEDDRFLFTGQNMESFELEIARQAIDVVRDIYKEKQSYPVTFPTANFVETVDWKDIDLESDQYVLKAYPTSELSDDLTGRLSEVQEMMQAGLVSPRTGKRLMGMPDLEMEENLANAAENRLHQIFEDMLDDGKYTAPEAPWHDLTLAKQLLVEYYNYAEFMHAPDSRLALLQRFSAELNDAMGLATPPPAPPMAPGGGAQPMANPTPTPQSNLVPNVAGGAQQ